MTQALPITRKPINAKQAGLLTTLYKFRFATAQTIASSQGSKYLQVINARLKVLYEQGYIARHYDSSYKIKGKPAVYFLAPRGIRYLKSQTYANSKVINGLYHDKRRSPEHISHCLNVFETYIQLKRLYQDQLKFFSKSELTGRRGLPKTLPDALLLIKGRVHDRQYFLDTVEEKTSYVQSLVKLKQYVAYAESEKWQKAFADMPAILLVCESESIMRRMQRLAQKELETTFAEIKFLVTTKTKLQSAQHNEPIWTDVDEPEEPRSLP